MGNSPLISVILPCYNGQDFIEESIQSILDQTYEHFELLITDDHSTDNSYQIIERFSKQIREYEYSKMMKIVGLFTPSIE